MSIAQYILQIILIEPSVTMIWQSKISVSMAKQSHLIKTHGMQWIGREWVYLEGAGGELDADGGLGLEAELVAGEPGEDVGLADAGVADEHDLEEVVVLVVHPVRHRRPTTARRPPPPRILQDSRRPTRSTR